MLASASWHFALLASAAVRGRRCCWRALAPPAGAQREDRRAVTSGSPSRPASLAIHSPTVLATRHLPVIPTETDPAHRSAHSSAHRPAGKGGWGGGPVPAAGQGGCGTHPSAPRLNTESSPVSDVRPAPASPAILSACPAAVLAPGGGADLRPSGRCQITVRFHLRRCRRSAARVGIRRASRGRAGRPARCAPAPDPRRGCGRCGGWGRGPGRG